MLVPLEQSSFLVGFNMPQLATLAQKLVEVTGIKARQGYVPVLVFVSGRKRGVNHILMPSFLNIGFVASLSFNWAEINSTHTITVQNQCRPISARIVKLACVSVEYEINKRTIDEVQKDFSGYAVFSDLLPFNS